MIASWSCSLTGRNDLIYLRVILTVYDCDSFLVLFTDWYILHSLFEGYSGWSLIVIVSLSYSLTGMIYLVYLRVILAGL